LRIGGNNLISITQHSFSDVKQKERQDIESALRRKEEQIRIERERSLHNMPDLKNDEAERPAKRVKSTSLVDIKPKIKHESSATSSSLLDTSAPLFIDLTDLD
jgi:hypothetical protein